ncbi:MAG: YjhG/YagF family D-xylonate dehydratase, partial [Planctomycetota bacterium]
RQQLVGTIDFVGDANGTVSPAEGARVLAERAPRGDLQPDAQLPADTRLWAALQRVGGGTWGGCVYDVDRIVEVLEAGERALASRTTS